MLHNFAGVWRALYPAEQLRITRLLIESVVVREEAVPGLSSGATRVGPILRGSCAPDGIGAELRELEAEGAAA